DLFERHDDGALIVVENGFRSGVDARAVVDEVLPIFGDGPAAASSLSAATAGSHGQLNGVRGVAGVKELHAVAVEAGAIEMHVVGVLTVFMAGGGEKNLAGFFVDVGNVLGDELALGDLILEGAVGIVEVELAPAITLAPPDQLGAVVNDAERFGFDIDIHALLDERLNLAGSGVDGADIHAMQIAAGAAEVELVGAG